MCALELLEGELYSCKLKGRGSAGYAWEYEIEGAANVIGIAVHYVGERPSARPGGPLSPLYDLEEFTITGLTPTRDGHDASRFL